MASTLTKRIQIIPAGDFKETYQTLRDWRYHSHKLANTIMSEMYSISQQVLREMIKDPNLKWKDCEDKLMFERIKDNAGKVHNVKASFGYCISKEPHFADNLPSGIRSILTTKVTKEYGIDCKNNGLLRGQVSLRNRKLDSMEINLPNGNVGKTSRFVLEEDGEYYFYTLQRLKFKVIFGRDKSNNKDAVNKLISGEYKMPDVMLKISDNKLFLLAPITMEDKEYKLDPSLSVGVDLGISIPAVCGLSKGLDRSYIGNGKDIVNYRFAMYKRRRNLQKSIQLSSGGRGRSKKLKALNRLSTIESNWSKTQNHRISKKIIDFALTNNAGCVKMELLEGFKEEHNSNMVLKNWTYFQLASMVEYKAKAVGISVVKIDPYHTSQMCSVCGHYEKGQRVNQSEFKCLNTECGYTANADYNASVNIAKSDKIVTKKEECQYNKNSK